MEYNYLNKEEVHNTLISIRSNLDYDRIYKVMKFLDWHWVGREFPVSIIEIKNHCDDIILRALEKLDQKINITTTEAEQFLATGGFEVSCYYYSKAEKSKQLYIDVKFCIAEWSDNG